MHHSGDLLCQSPYDSHIPGFINLSLEILILQLWNRVWKKFMSLLYEMLSLFVLADLYHWALAVGTTIKNRGCCSAGAKLKILAKSFYSLLKSVYLTTWGIVAEQLKISHSLGLGQ